MTDKTYVTFQPKPGGFWDAALAGEEVLFTNTTASPLRIEWVGRDWRGFPSVVLAPIFVEALRAGQETTK